MRSDFIEMIGDKVLKSRKESPRPIKILAPKKSTPKTLSYTERHSGGWHYPEYDFKELGVVQHVDSYYMRAMIRKLNKFIVAGYEWVGQNPKYVDYINRRITEIEITTGRPFMLQLAETARDVIRQQNCMWEKRRDRRYSSGKVRQGRTGRELEPVAGYFIMPFETLEFKHRRNGVEKKIKQVMPGGNEREFFPEDVIHFYMNKNPGFSVGTPEIVPVLDDIELLRRIEENVEALLESNLYPLFHYQIGTDEMPERKGRDGRTESEIAKDVVEYMPSDGIFFSDHRHKITAIGSEGRALRAESYLQYFRERVFAGLGMSGVDFGMGDTANRSTADSMSKGALQDIEALQEYMKMFIEKEVIQELLLEGGFGMEAFLPENKVEIKFGVIDKEVKSRDENQAIQIFLNNGCTHQEFRKRLGLPPMTEEDMAMTYFKLFEEPLALIKAGQLGLAASQALIESPTSAITEEGVKKEEEKQKKAGEARSAMGRPPNPSSTAAKAENGNKTNPANQSGKRGGQKYSKDFSERDLYSAFLSNADIGDTAQLNGIVSSFKTQRAEFEGAVRARAESMPSVSIPTVRESMDYRWQEICALHQDKAYNAGVLSSAEDISVLSHDDFRSCTDACIKKMAACITNTDNVFRVDAVPPYILD